MTLRLRIMLVGLILALIILACGLPPVGTTPSIDEIATIVAATLQALGGAPASAAPDTPTSTPSPEPSYLLHQSLYYQTTDGGGRLQVFRLGRDGLTITQLTFEPADVDDYDVSPLDGSLAYASNNQLLLVNRDGGGRRQLLDGGAWDMNVPFVNRVSSPRFSRDGQTIVLGYNGLTFYSVATGAIATLLPNNIEDHKGQLFPREIFSPAEYSPDGSRLLINIGWYEGGTIGVYSPATGALTHPSYEGIFCCRESWTRDSRAIYVASPWIGMVSPGLWLFDADSGAVTELLPSQAADGTWNFADAPLLGPDGLLYFFFSNLPDIPDGYTPLMLVRAAADGVTGRTLLYPETFSAMNEAIWSPDAAYAVVVQAIAENQWQGGRAVLFYTDGRLPVPLLPDARNMRWGP